MRKNLGFELLANQIANIYKNEQLSSIVVENRGDITRFNYYLNRFGNKFKDKIYLTNQNKVPGNYYEANYSFNLRHFNMGDKLLIISNNENKQSNEGFSDINLLRKISIETIDNIERTYFLYTANIVKK